jgi:hypothetical protein
MFILSAVMPSPLCTSSAAAPCAGTRIGEGETTSGVHGLAAFRRRTASRLSARLGAFCARLDARVFRRMTPTQERH